MVYHQKYTSLIDIYGVFFQLTPAYPIATFDCQRLNYTIWDGCSPVVIGCGLDILLLDLRYFKMALYTLGDAFIWKSMYIYNYIYFDMPR